MQKFKTEQRNPAEIPHGALVGVPGGFCYFWYAEPTTDGRTEITYATCNGRIEKFSIHPSNWPEVAIGFTEEYQSAYPQEIFQGMP
jgi:hypothetical protein